MSDLKADLAALVVAMPIVGDYGRRSQEPWHVDGTLPSTDFNREFCPPGAAARFPEGALGVRVDDDFWAVAVLPWRFSELSIQDLVAVLWPQYVGEASYNPDSHYDPKSPDSEEDL